MWALNSEYQTASLFRRTRHVGFLKPRCLAEHRCQPSGFRLLTFREIHQVEMAKPSPERYPSNDDSVGIELVGQAQLPATLRVPAELDELGKKRFFDQHAVYEGLTGAQQSSLTWLLDALRASLKIPAAEVFRHPDVSRKNPTEAASARW